MAKLNRPPSRKRDLHRRRTYGMKVRAPSNTMVKARASLTGGPTGYLWIPDDEGNCHGWINHRELVQLAIAVVRSEGYALLRTGRAP